MFKDGAVGDLPYVIGLTAYGEALEPEPGELNASEEIAVAGLIWRG